jgi:hypothetical protein
MGVMRLDFPPLLLRSQVSCVDNGDGIGVKTHLIDIKNESKK